MTLITSKFMNYHLSSSFRNEDIIGYIFICTVILGQGRMIMDNVDVTPVTMRIRRSTVEPLRETCLEVPWSDFQIM
jgi:hypothetical protein